MYLHRGKNQQVIFSFHHSTMIPDMQSTIRETDHREDQGPHRHSQASGFHPYAYRKTETEQPVPSADCHIVIRKSNESAVHASCCVWCKMLSAADDR